MAMRDSTLGELEIRPLAQSDSVEELTLLLNRAYKRLADMGLKYLATYQDADGTRKRIAGAISLVAVIEGQIVGTITYRGPQVAGGTEWYDRPEVAKISQMGVEPVFQRKGIGLQLIRAAEELAFEDSALELALDTAESAKHLIDWYERLGFRFVQYCNWDITNYRSVVMSKQIGLDPK